VIRAAYDEDAYRTELRAFGVWCIALGFGQFAYEDNVFPIRHFYQRWSAAIAIERRPSVAARLHAAEQALADPAMPGLRSGDNLGTRTRTGVQRPPPDTRFDWCSELARAGRGHHPPFVGEGATPDRLRGRVGRRRRDCIRGRIHDHRSGADGCAYGVVHRTGESLRGR